jgi:hypothetical protein
MPDRKKHSTEMRQYWREEKRKQRAGKTESRSSGSDNPFDIENPYADF